MTIEERSRDMKNAETYGDFTVLSQPVVHTIQSLAYKVERPNGDNFVYSGDTGFCTGIVDLAQGTDLLILESSFPNGQEAEGHLTPFLAGRVAALSKARRLVLLHFYPDILSTDIATQCRKSFSGELILGRDLLSLSI